MKKFLFIISFISVAATATAQHLVVEKNGYENEILQLEELKQITFSGTTVNIEKNSGTKSSTSMGNIDRIYFGDMTSIAEIGQEGNDLIAYHSFDEIAINAEAGSTVTIYSLTGTQMIIRRIQAQGETIGIASLPQGIYIVKANERTTKIIKR